jgi:tRNA threonylcarbamoyl adenosine modification protein YjeE
LHALGGKHFQTFSSPTFTIFNQYQAGSWQVNHVDLYRLNRYADFEDLDLTGYFRAPKTITLIEWGDKFPEMQGLYTKKISFEYVPDDSASRSISIQ